jgi:hypothetical protein
MSRWRQPPDDRYFLLMTFAVYLALLGWLLGPPPPRPKLVVVITVDQLRPDYLTRWKSQLTGGLGQLATEGAVFTDGYQDHAVTETAPGHSTILSGMWPAHTGIIRNSDGVQDSLAPLLGTTGPGASPRRFRGTTLVDWLKAVDPATRALSVSRKDRGAILPIGRAKEQVYWYQSGLFTTSRYYADSLPTWVQAFNARRLPFKAANTVWTLLLPDSAYKEPDNEVWENGGVGVVFPHALPADSIRAAAAVRARGLRGAAVRSQGYRHSRGEPVDHRRRRPRVRPRFPRDSRSGPASRPLPRLVPEASHRPRWT